MTVFDFIADTKSKSLVLKHKGRFIRYWDQYGTKLEKNYLRLKVIRQLENLPGNTPVLEVA